MKILVSDFDNTLFNYNYKQNVKAINEFVDEGNIFVIATGRGYDSLKNDLDKDLKYSYLICNDGAMLYDDKRLIYFREMNFEVIKDVFERLTLEKCVGEPLIDNFNNLKNSICKGVAVIAPIIDRKYYDHKKRQHDGFKLVLNIIRILAIALLAYIFILALVTTLQEKPSQEYLNYVTSSNNVTNSSAPLVVVLIACQ